MNIEKLKRVNICLYAMCAVKAASALYITMTMSSITHLTDLVPADSSIATYSSLIFAVGLFVFSYFIIDGLKQVKLWAWIAAISVLMYGLPSIALPASVIGLLSLFDTEVRTPFLKELDFKF